MNDIIVVPKDCDRMSIIVMRDYLWVDAYSDNLGGNCYVLLDGKWVKRKTYEKDKPHTCSFRLAVTWRERLRYRWEDWRDATSFRMTGKKSWWRKK